MNQFYYKEYSNTEKIFINLNEVISIMQVEKSVVIKTSNSESIKEMFNNSEEAEEYLTYILKALYHGERVISRNLFDKTSDKDETE